MVIRKGLRIEGAPGGDPTIIRGGGAPFPLGIPITGLWAADVSSGPFRVEVESEGEWVSFERLQFRRWENQAITAVAAGGLSVIDCTFTDPVTVPWPTDPDRASPAVAGLKGVNAVLVLGPEVRGRFLATGNAADLLTDYEGSLADDETFIALLFTSFDDIRIERNTIRGHDDGLEVIRNKFDLSEYGLVAPSEGASAIRVADNAIELLQIPPSIPMKWYGMAGIIVAGNERVSEGIVEDNDVSLVGTPLGYGSPFTGSNLLVRRNAFTLLPLAENVFPGGVFALGFGNPFAGSPFNLGASLDDSVLEDNVFEQPHLARSKRRDVGGARDPLRHPFSPRQHLRRPLRHRRRPLAARREHVFGCALHGSCRLARRIGVGRVRRLGTADHDHVHVHVHDHARVAPELAFGSRATLNTRVVVVVSWSWSWT